MNIERRTSNADETHRNFSVRCSAFDVRCFRFHSHASSTRLDFGLQMHVKHEPVSALAPCDVRYSTSPDLIATRQVPQFPARQPASIFTPRASAKSSNELRLGSQ